MKGNLLTFFSASQPPRLLLRFLLMVVIFSSCRNIDVFEKNTVIPSYKWSSSYAATGSFIVSDTATPFNLSVVLRHTDRYAYNNIWLNIGFQAPGDSMRFQKVNLRLGSDARGWEGSSMDDIWEVRTLLSHYPRLKPGEYHFSLRHIMRDEPLPGIMSAGIRLEKVP